MSTTDEIKAKIDIVTYIQQYAQLKKAGRTFKACCPFHQEKTPSFVVDPIKQTWRCFGACAEGGDLFTFAMKQHGWSFKEALTELGRQAGVQVQQQSPEQRAHTERLDKLRGLLKTAADIFHRHLLGPQGVETLKYAQIKRGFTKDTIDAFEIGYAPPGWQNLYTELTQLGYSEEDIIASGMAIRSDKGRVYDRFRNRLIIPIRDDRGRVIGFGARALDPDDNPKYLNSPQTEVFDKSKTLFGLDTAKNSIRDTETAIIVEGYMDAIQAQQAGFTNVVAQMGTAMTEEQLNLIVPRFAKKIILALDSDAAGQNATMRSLEVARNTLQADYAGRLSVDIRILQIPGAKDPDDLIRETPDQWQALVDDAMPVADFVIDMETRTLTPNATVQEREAIARRLLPILMASENDLYSKDNLQRMALRLRIPERDMLMWAAEQSKSSQPSSRTQSRNNGRENSRYTPRSEAPSNGQYHEDEPRSYSAEPPPLDMSTIEPPAWIEDSYDGGFVEPYDGGYDSGYVPDYREPQAPLPRPEQRVERPPRPQNNYVRPDAQATGPARGYELEGLCMRMLLQQPDFIYQINRKLRELANGDERLMQRSLADLSVEDFQHSDYRTLMQMFKLAMKQDELGPLEFLADNLDRSLLVVLQNLLDDEADKVRERIQRRFDGDAIVWWKHHERHNLSYVDNNAEFIDAILRLRLQRLKRELSDIHFLQRSVEHQDIDGNEVIQQLMQNNTAIRLIETERNRRGNFP